MRKGKNKVIENLKKSVKELFENSSDENVIKQYAVVEKEIDELKKEQEELLNRNAKLQSSLKDVIINKEFPKDDVKEKEDEPITLESLISKEPDYREVIKKGGK